MTAYFVYAACLVGLIALVVWRPQGSARFVRNYVIVLLGFFLLFAALEWLLPRVGHAELTLGEGLVYASLGGATALAAALRFPPYWELASEWPLWRSLAEPVRQVVLALAGVALLIVGCLDLAGARAAVASCHSHYAAASPHERLRVLTEIPDSGLRPYRDATPYRCSELIDKR